MRNIILPIRSEPLALAIRALLATELHSSPRQTPNPGNSVMIFSHMQLVVFTSLAVAALESLILLRWRRTCRKYLAKMATSAAATAASLSFTGDPPWFHWLHQRLRESPAVDPAQFQQRAAAELDLELETNAGYVFLQRLSSVGPLVGVLLTTIAFWRLAAMKIPLDGDSPLVKLLGEYLQPLSLGMGAGVVIALFHQLLVMQLAGVFVDRVRRSAHVWLDDVLLPSLDPHNPQFSGDGQILDSAMNSLADVCDQASKRWEALVESAAQNVFGCQELTQELKAAVAQVGVVSSSAKAFDTATRGSTKRLTQLVSDAEKHLGDRFLKIAENCERSITVSADSVTRLNDQIGTFETASQTLTACCAQLRAACDRVQEMMQLSGSAHGELHDDLGNLHSALTQIQTPLVESTAAMTAAQEAFARAGASMEQSQTSFGGAISVFANLVENDLAPICGQHKSLVADSGQALAQSAEVSRQAALSLEEFQRRCDQMGRDAGELQSASGELRSAVEVFSEVSESSLTYIDTLRTGLEPMVRLLADSHRDATKILRGLAQNVDPLSPAITELSESSQQLRKLLESLAPLAGSSDRLIDALRRLDQRLLTLPGELRARRTKSGFVWWPFGRKAPVATQSGQKPIPRPPNAMIDN